MVDQIKKKVGAKFDGFGEDLKFMKKYKPTVDAIRDTIDTHLENGIPDLPFKIPEFNLFGKYNVDLNDKDWINSKLKDVKAAHNSEMFGGLLKIVGLG